ncbi:hypothetical protein [Psychromicrobium lacuslunae]|uniref:hypothetical protein n=1 Tax=Psychromicrobium lacuslunae TaxID=1618207 RepID=UPI000696A057|nr:hypothetical protein [Psychromicrobium lacuslunae]
MSSLQAGRPTAKPDLWRPVLWRALIALAFGLLTVFWPDISPLFRAIAVGVYFLGSAAAVLSLLLLVRAGLPAAHRWLWLELLVFAIAGIALFFLQDNRAFAWSAAVALFVTGMIELVLGFRYRLQTVLGRDWLITGAIALLAAVLLVSLAGTSARAPIGVLGGSAVIIGVVAVLAALSYRHEAGLKPGTEDAGQNPSLRGVE